MKSIEAFLAELQRLDIQLSVHAEQLRVNAPEGAVTPSLRAELGERKSEILPYLRTLDRAAKSTPPPLRPVPRDRQIPLSLAQQRLWFLDQIEGPNATYNVPMAMRLQGKLHLSALDKSFCEIVRRHEVLRTRLVTTGGQAAQVIDDPCPIRIPVIGLQSTVDADALVTVRRLVAREAQRPFDLAVGPLLRVMLFRITEDDHVLFLNLHHVVSDGWSMGIFAKEITALYEAYSNGAQPSLPELSLQYADYACWQRNWLQGDVLEDQLRYWRRQLAGLPPILDVPTDRPRSSLMGYRGNVVPVRVGRDLTRQLKDLGRRSGATLFMTLLAAYATLLSRYSVQRDIAVGTTIANRTHPLMESLIGFFVNTLVLRCDLSGDPTFSELLGRMRTICLEAYDHQDLPFAHLVEAIQPERNLSHTPLFQAMLMLQNAPMNRCELPGLAVLPFDLRTTIAHFDLNLSLTETPSGMEGAFEYRADLFEESTIVRMVSHFQTLLEGAASDPNALLSKLPLLSGSEQRRQLVEWNATRFAYSRELCLQQVFEQQVQRDPEGTAVVFEDLQTSYRTLDGWANQLARLLRGLGVGPEIKVCILMQRSLEMIVAMLGILKAGGAYVPVHHHWPQRRGEHILSSLGVSVLITRSSQLPASQDLQRDAAGLKELVCLDCTSWTSSAKAERGTAAHSITAGKRLWTVEHLRHLPTDKVGELSTTSENTAYIIFTSGSTGLPKGVVVRHKPVVNVIEWVNRTFGVGARDRVLFVTSICFDLSVYDVFGLLAAGGSIHVATEVDLENPERLVQLLYHEPITFWDSAPAALEQLSPFFPRGQREGGTDLRLVFLSGDWIPLSLPDRVRAAFPRAQVISLGGATEAAIWSNYYPIGVVDPSWASIPYGRPIQNARYYILDPHLNPCPVGVAGELHIGGECLASGYANDAGQTAEKFIPDPFGDYPGTLLYKTGDLSRFRPDSNIEILGRLDHQVKLRGYRIETGEIEAVLMKCPAVEKAVVLVREERLSTKQLVAYIGCRPTPSGKSVTVSVLRDYLHERLPDYMVPAAFVVLDELPLTSNGKIDRQALPAPEKNPSHPEFAPPLTREENILHAIWSDVLGHERIGVHDNFFDVGGDSIMSIQIIARARQAGLLITPRQIFQYQTIAELAAVVETAETAAEQGTVIGDVPLTPVQHWFFEQHLARPQHFNQSVLLETPADINADVLARSIAQLVQHHDAIRFRFHRNGSAWQQSCASSEEHPIFSVVDLSKHTEARQRAILEATSADVQATLNLELGPLMRVALFEYGSTAPGRLLVVLHHLIVDGISWRILLEDLQTIYEQLLDGRQAQLPAKTTSFQQWARRLKQYAHTDEVAADLAFWRVYSRTPVVRLPVDYPNSVDANTVGSTSQIYIALTEAETSALLYETPRTYNTQINDVLLAALAQALAAWAPQQTLLIDLEGHGREPLFDDVDVSRTVGWFTTLYPVLVNTERLHGPGEALTYVKEQLRAIPIRGLGFGLLRYLSDDPVARAMLRQLPQAEISLNYLGQLEPAAARLACWRAAQESAGPPHDPNGRRHYLIDVSASVSGGALHMQWLYSGNLFRPATIERWAQDCRSALVALIEHCRSAEAGKYTPADFPAVELTQDRLDRVLAEIDFENDP